LNDDPLYTSFEGELMNAAEKVEELEGAAKLNLEVVDSEDRRSAMAVYAEDMVGYSLERKGVSHLVSAAVLVGDKNVPLDKKATWASQGVADGSTVSVEMVGVSTGEFIQDILQMHPRVGHTKLTAEMVVNEAGEVEKWEIPNLCPSHFPDCYKDFDPTTSQLDSICRCGVTGNRINSCTGAKTYPTRLGAGGAIMLPESMGSITVAYLGFADDSRVTHLPESIVRMKCKTLNMTSFIENTACDDDPSLCCLPDSWHGEWEHGKPKCGEGGSRVEDEVFESADWVAFEEEMAEKGKLKPVQFSEEMPE